MSPEHCLGEFIKNWKYIGVDKYWIKLMMIYWFWLFCTNLIVSPFAVKIFFAEQSEDVFTFFFFWAWRFFLSGVQIYFLQRRVNFFKLFLLLGLFLSGVQIFFCRAEWRFFCRERRFIFCRAEWRFAGIKGRRIGSQYD